ncbi:MAG TPA: ATP-binding protein [Polaromonas sp.]|uniref:sensor histidine kinase n=1 Tax=Polaromonas sp. TaxID=1869339 RepID=UPI002D435911|nr:ATP-binding protein [Polaromonas sp.]HYW55968.1 ATP-binding protein [Polaromonas sp.]
MTSPAVVMGLRARIILLVALAALLPATVAMGFLFKQRDHDIAHAKDNLAALARGASNELRVKIQGTHQLLFGLARSRKLDVDERDACSAYLAEVLKQHPQYTGILTIKPNGDLHCDSLRTGRKLNLTDRAYFQQAMESTAPALEAVFGRLTGIGVVQVAHASRDPQGKVRFVLLASIDLNQFSRELAAAQPYSDTAITLFNRAGVVLTSGSTRAGGPGVGRPTPGVSLASTELGRFAINGNNGDTAEFAGPAGVQRAWAVGTLPQPWDAGIQITLGVPTRDLAAHTERHARIVLAGVMGAAILALLLAWAFGELGVRRPLGRIMEGTARLRNGNLDARIGPPYPRGEIGDLMKTLDDTSNKVQVNQQEIQQLNDGLEEHVRVRTAELETVNQELQAFSYSLAHDLRQPLITIHGFCDQLGRTLQSDASEQQNHYLKRIQANVRKIAELSDAMASLARLSRPQLESSAVDVSAIAGAALAACQQRDPDRVATLRVQAEMKATADPAMLKLAIDHLIDNAWKFTRERASTEISVGCADDPDGTQVFHVKDNGVGFEMAHASKLFNAFQRLHLVADFSGTGIGLASVHKIITRHGGKVWANSTPGEGATFYFTLRNAST